MENKENENSQMKNEIKKYEKNKKKLTLFVNIIISFAILFPIIVIGILMCNQYENITTAAKPIIYLYPEETTELSVTLGKPENVTCSYPNYENSWNVVANSDGSLIDTNTGRNLYALYWEGINKNKVNFDEGFVVKSEDTIKFLEDKLAILGLNERESEEFIVYWLPRLQENNYNLIRFASMDEINEIMPLNFSVQPDSIIRVLMQYKKIDKPIEIEEQQLTTPERKGFVAVEWGRK